MNDNWKQNKNLFPDFYLMSFKIVRSLHFFCPCMYNPVSVFVTSKGREKGIQNIESTSISKLLGLAELLWENVIRRPLSHLRRDDSISTLINLWENSTVFLSSFFFSLYQNIVDWQYYVSFSKVIQLYIYIYLFFFKFLSLLGCYRILSRVSWAIQ